MQVIDPDISHEKLYIKWFQSSAFGLVFAFYPLLSVVEKHNCWNQKEVRKIHQIRISVCQLPLISWEGIDETSD